jgi:IS30 family transposase
MYTHISREDRTAIAALMRLGCGTAEIAWAVGKDRTTVWRELRRNSGPNGYAPERADAAARGRRAGSRLASRRLENDPALAAAADAALDVLTSPEVVAHRLGLCHATIYAWIARSRPDIRARLPFRGRKRRRYGAKRAKKQGWTRLVRPIDERPEAADSRSEAGHFEGDTVRGNGALLTHTDRASRFELAYLVPNEGADAALEAIVRNGHLRGARSMTYDRGSTFAEWRMIEEATGAQVFFAHARSPWERGTNENANGRLRRVFPKGFDFATITQADVDAVTWKMNHTPRKCLGWGTPCRAYGRCCTSA